MINAKQFCSFYCEYIYHETPQLCHANGEHPISLVSISKRLAMLINKPSKMYDHHHVDYLQLDRMLLANLATKLIDKQRCRNQSYRNESQNAITPSQPKRLIHAWASKWQESTK